MNKSKVEYETTIFFYYPSASVHIARMSVYTTEICIGVNDC